MNKFYFLLAKNKKLKFKISSLINLYAEIKQDDIILTFEKTAKDFENGLLHDKKVVSTLENPTLEELNNILSFDVIKKQINDAYCNKLGIFNETSQALHEMQNIIEYLPGISPLKRKMLKDIFEITAETTQIRLSPHFSLCLVDTYNQSPTKPCDLHFQLKQHIPSKQQITQFLPFEDFELIQQIGRLFDKNQNAIFGVVLYEKSKLAQHSCADLLIYEHLKRKYQFQPEK